MKHYITLIVIFAVLFISIPALVAWGMSPSTEKPVLPQKISVYFTADKTIKILPYRDYIIGCTFGTIPPDCEKEAIKAAACACSTLAIYQLENCDRAAAFGADATDDPEVFQPYIPPEQLMEEYGQSYDRLLARVEECVDEALNYVITCNGEVIFPAMCSISAGATDSAEEIYGKPLEYLKPTSAACDRESPDYISTALLSADYVRRSLMQYAEGVRLPQNTGEWFGEAEYLPSGTLVSIKYGSTVLSGEIIREALSLRSAAISVEYTEDMLKFTVKGCGNNVGMSLYCANQLALQGEKMTDILGYFYSETELTPVTAQ